MICDGGVGGVATRPATKVIRKYNNNNNNNNKNVRRDTYYTHNNIIYIHNIYIVRMPFESGEKIQIIIIMI
jgi:hypothetical protein